MLLVEPLQLVFPTLVSQTLPWMSTMFTSFQIYKYSWLPPQSRSRMIRTAWRLVIASVTTWWRSAGQPAVAGGSPRYPQYTTSTSIQVPNVSTMPRSFLKEWRLTKQRMEGWIYFGRRRTWPECWARPRGPHFLLLMEMNSSSASKNWLALKKTGYPTLIRLPSTSDPLW